MASAVSICSNAYLSLGDKSLSSFEESNDNAERAANLFPSVRDFILRSHPWNCAVKRVALSPDETPPAFGYSYQFTLPGDWLRTLSIGEPGDDIDHVTENMKILANTNVLYLRYIFRNIEVNSWDAMLIHCMEKAMAAALAYPVTQSTSLKEACVKEVNDALKTARAVDGIEDPPEDFGDFPLLRSRF